MMRPILLCAALALLAACGVDGRPIPPAGSEAQAPKRGPNVTLSGEINVGVVVD